MWPSDSANTSYPRVYPEYRPDYAVNPTNPHLHNVPVQIAAERGLPALVAWLWFVVVAGRDLVRQLLRGESAPAAGAGLAALVAMLSAGLFEYNFGDSEFLMLFLGLIALPHAARAGTAPGGPAAGPRRSRPVRDTPVRDAVSTLLNRRVAVIGDLMLDHFLIGRVDRISPEAPVPVVRFERDEHRLGGAANVANNVAALGGRALLVGVVGDDPSATRMREELARHGLDAGHLVVVPERPTTRKVRVVTTRNQQVARIDYEADDTLPPAGLDAVAQSARRAVSAADAVILSDYRKGVVSPEVMAAAVAAARGRSAPVLVDPKVPLPDRYRGVTVITPNHHEAEVMTQMAIRTPDDVRTAARMLHQRTGASVVVTWGEHGMWVIDAATDRPVEEHLAASAREVADVTGAGDTVIAVLGLGLAAGLSLAEAARLANAAAGLVVARFGPAAVSADELRASLET